MVFFLRQGIELTVLWLLSLFSSLLFTSLDEKIYHLFPLYFMINLNQSEEILV